MPAVSEGIQRAIEREQCSIADTARELAALHALYRVPGVEHAYAALFHFLDERVEVSMTLAPGADARASVKATLAALGAKRADKTFDAAEGKIKYAIKAPLASVTITAGAPERCEVERMEEEIEVPAEPARIEKRVRFVLKDPACLGNGAAPAATIPDTPDA